MSASQVLLALVASLTTGVPAIVTVIVLWRKFQREELSEDERQHRLEASDNLGLLKAAVDAYNANTTSLASQLDAARAEQRADRDRHSRELSEVRAALSRCESERVDQGREIGALTARLARLEEVST